MEDGRMAELVRIVGIAGSLRKGSYNRSALRAAVKLVPPGSTLEISDLDDIPPFNEDHERDPPAAVRQLRAAVKAADAVLIATPEYNYSVPGMLKNAIDWASRPYGESTWNGKPVGIMGASVGVLGTARAQYHLRQMFVFLNMFPLNQPEVMISGAHKHFDDQGNLTDEVAKKLIRQLLEELVALTRQLRK